MFVGCILVSYPLQFYVPMERIEKWISRKIVPEKQDILVYLIRYILVAVTCRIFFVTDSNYSILNYNNKHFN